MVDLQYLDKQCLKCGGLGKIVNPVWYPVWFTSSNQDSSFSGTVLKLDHAELSRLDEPKLYVCPECNGKGRVLTDRVKELLEYILS